MVESNLGRWTVAALLALAAVPVFWLPVLMGEDVIGWPTTLAADALLALALVIVMRDARRRTFGWMAGLALVTFVVAVVVHNVEYAVTGVEEPTFLIAAIVVAPAMLIVGATGLVWRTIHDNRAPRAGDHTARPA